MGPGTKLPETQLCADLQLHQLSAAKPIISRSKSASALFTTSECRFIISSAIGDLSQVELEQPDPTGKTLMAAFLLHHSLGRHPPRANAAGSFHHRLC